MKKKKNNLPIFEDQSAKRDIEFFPDVCGCYAIRNAAIERHSDSDGDPWSIFGPKGGNMATFCTRKSKIHLWPFHIDPESEASIYSVEKGAKCIKLARYPDVKTSLKNATRFAWLKWPYSHRIVNKHHFENTVVGHYGDNGLFYVPYNKDKEIYGLSYLIFNSDGKIIGRVVRDRHYENGDKKIFKGYYKYQGCWHEEVREDRTLKETLQHLLFIIEDETTKYIK